jgi:hypothetical protein
MTVLNPHVLWSNMEGLNDINFLYAAHDRDRHLFA